MHLFELSNLMCYFKTNSELYKRKKNQNYIIILTVQSNVLTHLSPIDFKDIAKLVHRYLFTFNSNFILF